MTTEEIVKDIEKKIKDIKSKIKSAENELSDAESKRRMSQSDKTMGLIMMNNQHMKTYGTYKFITSLGDEGKYSTRISRLKGEISDLKRKLSKHEKELKEAKEKLAYEKRPEATLVVADDRIHIEGDDARRDIVKPLASKDVEYIQDYDSYAESPEVADYLKLKKELDGVIEVSDLPKATKENLDEIKSAQIRSSFSFEYMVIDGKILVDRDFASGEIREAAREVENYDRGIAKVDASRDEFRPSFLGRLFRSVGKKQKMKNDAIIDDNIKELSSYRGLRQSRLDSYQGYKDKYIVPATEAMDILRKITQLTQTSSNVSRFINEGETAKKHIDEKTILQALKVNAENIVLSEIKGYLDSRGLKLSKETIFEAICHSDTYRWLAEQVRATGFKPSEQIKQTGTQPGEE